MTSTYTHLLERLTAAPPGHERFQGAPIDITGLSALELGRLVPHIEFADWNEENEPARAVAQAIRKQAQQAGLKAAYDAQSCAAALRRVHNCEVAVARLAALIGEPSEAVAEQLRRILDKPEGGTSAANYPYQAYLCARFIDDAACEQVMATIGEKFSASSYRLQECALLERLEKKSLFILAGARLNYYWPSADSDTPDPAIELSDDAAYLAFSRAILEQATQHLRDIHDGAVAYVADGAFTVDDAHVIARAARVAALRDEPWLRDMIATLLPQACVAPTNAKTAPSQSLAIALGHSIEGAPTPEAVQALREALSVVRHAGLEKKLARNLKPAERALAARPEVALRVASDPKLNKRQQAMLVTCLEAGYWQPLALDWTDWSEKILNAPSAAPLAHALIWLACFGDTRQSFMVQKSKAGISTTDAMGQAVDIPASAQIMLWHPLHALEAEREAWQGQIIARKIAQPIRQAFREYYAADPAWLGAIESDEFAGHALSLRPLIGLARREGWSIERDGGLIRHFGELRAAFLIGSQLYPGITGSGTSMQLRFARRKGDRWEAPQIGEIDPIVYSEVCRAVDLLVSVTTFALDEPDPSNPGYVQIPPPSLHSGIIELPALSDSYERIRRVSKAVNEQGLSAIAAMRRRVLIRAFDRQIAEGKITVDERRVHVSPYAVHLASARVTKAGAPVELPREAAGSKLAAVPWLPYDEVLLEKIADSVATLLHWVP